MVGQIRSYISFLSADSDAEYINRIKNMIDNIEDDALRASLILEYTNKLHEIELIKKYKRPEVVDIPSNEEVDNIEEPSIFDQLKSFEEELDEKIKEYQDFKNDGKLVERKPLPPIYASAYGIAKIVTNNLSINKNMPTNSNDKSFTK